MAPELQAVDIALELVLMPIPEVDLLENIQVILKAKLDSYLIGENLDLLIAQRYSRGIFLV